MGQRTRARSRQFWGAADELEKKRHEPAEIRRRFPAAAWTVDLVVMSDGAQLRVKLTELSETGVRLLVPRALARDVEIGLRIEDPDFHEVLERDATVAWATPPPPSGDTWVTWADFPALTRDQQLRIAKWQLHYASKDIETSRRRRDQEHGTP